MALHHSSCTVNPLTPLPSRLEIQDGRLAPRVPPNNERRLDEISQTRYTFEEGLTDKHLAAFILRKKNPQKTQEIEETDVPIKRMIREVKEKNS